MTLPRTAADVLSEHVTLEVECIDRMYLNVYVPQLQFPLGLVGYVHRQLGLPIASTAPLAKVSDRFGDAVHRFARDHGIPWVDFAKGQRKDDVMHEHLARFPDAEGVVFIGRAQERTTLFRTEKRRDAEGRTYPWIVRTTGVVNHFYFYCLDEDMGPFFLKFCSYFPYNAKLCINGNEWAKCQVAKAGIAFTPLDNGFSGCADPAALQAICDAFGREQIEALLGKWLALLPHPFSPEDREAGYRYRLSVLQAEFSLTQVLDRPVAGRVFFEQVIRDNLDAGRPDRVSLVFARRLFRRGPRATPGRFRTRVLTDGVTPSLHVDYKNATVKQYHKEGQALRTETTVNNPRDFGIGKRLTNLPALRQVGFAANRRLLGAQTLSHDPTAGDTAFRTVTAAATTPTGQRIPGLGFTDARAQALLSALLVFRLLLRGFTNRDLREHLAPLLGLPPGTITSGQASYDLRRLRTHGLIERIPHTHRYRVTDTGHHQALFLTRAHNRLLRTGLAELADPCIDTPTPLRKATAAYDAAVDRLARDTGLAA
jgi:hypothetical protein